MMFLVLVTTAANAQFEGPPDPCTDPAFPCPIDGGLSLLIAAAVGIGAKKAYDAKKQEKSTSF